MAVEVGSIVEGKVTGVKKFGAFVLLRTAKRAWYSEIAVSNEYVQELSDVLSEGQTVKVKVMNVSDDGKIALSIKRTCPSPSPPGRPGPRVAAAPERTSAEHVV